MRDRRCFLENLLRGPIVFALVVALVAAELAAGLTAQESGSLDTFVEVAQLQPGDSDFDSIAISGDLLVISEIEENAQGALYVYERNRDGVWDFAQRLTTVMGAPNQLLGSEALAVDGDRIAAATYVAPFPVVVFERQPDGSWVEQPPIIPQGVQRSFDFGFSLDLDGEVLALSSGGTDDRGEVRVYERSEDGSWEEVDRISGGGLGSDSFGKAVSVDEARLAVAASTSPNETVYLFDRDGIGNWALSAELQSDFGAQARITDVSLDGTRVAFSDDAFNFVDGIVLVYARQVDGSWTKEQTVELVPGEGELFGTQIALDDPLLVVTDERDDGGVAYVFERDGSNTWSQTSTLRGSDGDEGDSFGYYVDLDQRRVAVHALQFDEDGSTYVFEERTVDPQLAITGTCPGDVTLVGSQLTPNSGVALIYSDQVGSFVLGGGDCPGTELGLEQPSVRFGFGADAGQRLEISGALGDNLCHLNIQLLDLASCLTSAVQAVP